MSIFAHLHVNPAIVAENEANVDAGVMRMAEAMWHAHDAPAGHTHPGLDPAEPIDPPQDGDVREEPPNPQPPEDEE